MNTQIPDSWEALNAAQGRLYNAGLEGSDDYKDIINRMIPLWPASGYGQPPAYMPLSRNAGRLKGALGGLRAQ